MGINKIINHQEKTFNDFSNWLSWKITERVEESTIQSYVGWTDKGQLLA